MLEQQEQNLVDSMTERADYLSKKFQIHQWNSTNYTSDIISHVRPSLKPFYYYESRKKEY